VNETISKQQPPSSEPELMQRVDNIAGLKLKELAHQNQLVMPKDLTRHKGWVGQLIEHCLGASAGSKPVHDFPQLGIELKTLPLSYQLSPLETTYVCYAHLTGNQGITWNSSNVKNKLNRVLWVPLEGERDIPLQERTIGSGFIWTPSKTQEALLKQDWEELIDMISLGQVERINARIGQVMQIRPKAADGQQLTDAIGEDGSTIKTRPRGFYLRKSFTQTILEEHFS
jgi:DNA mismatch repair protein MutH